MKKLSKKFNNLCARISSKAAAAMSAASAHLKAAQNDVSGSETTEKIGMVVAAVVIVGLLITAITSFMPDLFESIISIARTKLEGWF